MRGPASDAEPAGAPDYDVIVVGGGPAGLAAALWLARYRRRVLVLDAGASRNQPAWAVHGYPGIMPDPSPSELRRILTEQAVREGAQIETGEVLEVRGSKGEFTVHARDHPPLRARRVILAYGLRDYIPAIPGVEALYGRAIFHCPDCDGPTVAGARVAVIGHDRPAAAQALYLLNWTERVTLLAHGSALALQPEAERALAGNDIAVRVEEVARIEGADGAVVRVHFEDDSPALDVDAIFFHIGTEQRCAAAAQLGCRLDEDGYIEVDRGRETSVAGVHAAGDITGHPHLVSVAAADGVRAALAIHRSLLPESRHIQPARA